MPAKWISANYVSCIFQNFPWGYRKMVFIKEKFSSQVYLHLPPGPKLAGNKGKFEHVTLFVLAGILSFLIILSVLLGSLAENEIIFKST